jgi:hypothetical protein|nr:hypothetical protein [Kofleriaceae bacterium]
MAPLEARAIDARKLGAIAAAVGAAGAVALAIGIAVSPQRALAAYLVAWTSATTLAIGALAMLVIGYAANARWPAAIRRICEACAAALLPLAVLAIPLFVFASDVWPWVDPQTPEIARAVAPKAAYLALPAFAIRTALYFVVFVVVTELLRAWSLRRDRVPEASVMPPGDALDRERTLACAMMIPLGLAVTFAAFDWLMSLQPAWSSTVFGLYLTAGALAGGLALVIVVSWRATRARAVPLTGPHFHAMGRLLLAYSILWTYLAYFQAFLIQIADRPDEVTFFQARTLDGWRTVTLLLVALRIALPFPLLMSRRLKHRPAYLGSVAIVAIAAHCVDMWWLVVPATPGRSPMPSWLDVAAFACVFGLGLAAAAWRARGKPLVAAGDPYLEAALAYRSKT